MTDRTWIGGGNNDASDPNDWNPTGVPLLGDSLLMPDGGTMNIIGNDLVGDRLQVGNPNNSVDVTRTMPLPRSLRLVSAVFRPRSMSPARTR